MLALRAGMLGSAEEREVWHVMTLINAESLLNQSHEADQSPQNPM
ncbi:MULTISPECIES: hypothetical protein [Glutamicibacter]|uniref:Uncharacterized protein n=1 Tax=Glutamicibacter arilaitensis (strain DSM 16368 / CIP 108037 / IAM 15318 / JCM 13566 / NCIMB 14258 / Re117) TaxID=861360 RepID=A0ABM9PXC1_GLUAR|nr:MULTISPECIES: hypothetical protein [Glutamicibacter]CBT75977.1 hypothetical protein AARI_17630 [Glutamicibacter arilaitensis Re117]